MKLGGFGEHHARVARSLQKPRDPGRLEMANHRRLLNEPAVLLLRGGLSETEPAAPIAVLGLHLFE